jgi:hypothetical protein
VPRPKPDFSIDDQVKKGYDDRCTPMMGGNME